MATAVYLPEYSGLNGKRRTIRKWGRSPGDPVIIGQVLCYYESDGMTLPLKSPGTGVVLEICCPEKETAENGAPVCVVGQRGEDVSALRSAPSRAEPEAVRNPRAEWDPGSDPDVREARRLIGEAEAAVRSFRERSEALERLNCAVSERAPFVVTFAGRFKTGKSSLLNALLGVDLLPTKATTATAIVTRIFRGDTLRAWVRYRKQNYPVSAEAAKQVILTYDGEGDEEPAEVIFEAPIPWLPPYVELRDTPGTSDTLVLERMAAYALEDTDLCVCVYDAGAMLSEAERASTAGLHRELGGNLAFAVNRTNLLNSPERLREVEALSDAFFGSYGSPVEGMGRHFILCSAPGMEDLDGFDSWLKDLVSPGNAELLSRLRSAACSARMEAEKERERLETAAFAARIKALSDLLRKKHREVMREKGRTLREEAERERASVYRDLAAAESSLIGTAGLEERLNALLDGGPDWQADYAARAKETALQFFRSRFEEVRKDYAALRILTDGRFIESAFSVLSFPGPLFTTVPAEGMTVAGAAAVGAGFGTMIAPGVGTVIGGFIGALIGGSDTETRNDSVPNTMEYIRASVIPALQKSLRAAVGSACDEIGQRADREAARVLSGLEEILAGLDHAGSDLGAYTDRYSCDSKLKVDFQTCSCRSS